MGTLTVGPFDPDTHTVPITVAGVGGGVTEIVITSDFTAGGVALGSPVVQQVYRGPPVAQVVDRFPIVGDLVYYLFEDGTLTFTSTPQNVDVDCVVLKSIGADLIIRPPIDATDLTGWARRGRSWVGNVIGQPISVSVSDVSMTGKNISMTLRPLDLVQLQTYADFFWLGGPFLMTASSTAWRRGLFGFFVADDLRDRQAAHTHRIDLRLTQVYPAGLYTTQPGPV